MGQLSIKALLDFETQLYFTTSPVIKISPACISEQQSELAPLPQSQSTCQTFLPSSPCPHPSLGSLARLPFYTIARRLLTASCLLAAQSIMSRVQIDNISVENPKAAPADTIRLAVTFTALAALPQVLTWRLTYVGSAFSEERDQLLEEFEIGPIAEASTMSFSVEVDPPALEQVPREELLCTTAMIMSVAYRGQEFARIGYYVLNTYRGEADDPAALPLEELLAHTERVIIHEKPRVTKFEIKWAEECEGEGAAEASAGGEAGQAAGLREEEVREQKESLGELKEGEAEKLPLEPGSAPQRAETDA